MVAGLLLAGAVGGCSTGSCGEYAWPWWEVTAAFPKTAFTESQAEELTDEVRRHWQEDPTPENLADWSRTPGLHAAGVQVLISRRCLTRNINSHFGRPDVILEAAPFHWSDWIWSRSPPDGFWVVCMGTLSTPPGWDP